MKRLLVVLVIFAGLLITSVQAQTTPKKMMPLPKKTVTPQTKVTPTPQKEVTVGKEKPKESKTVKPTLKGVVVSLNKLVMGEDGSLKKEEAQTMADKGSPIVLLVGKGKSGKIYFVYNSDGSFGGKNLAKFAGTQEVGIIGKVKTINGLKVIIATKIEAL